MPGKEPEDYDLDEVCLFLNAIGLDSKVEAFRANAVDGPMLVGLEDGDFKELGLTGLQAKKVKKYVEFSKELAYEQGGGEGGGADAAASAQRIQELEAENVKLKDQVAELKSVLEAMQKPPEPPKQAATRPAAPAPAPYAQPPQPRREAHVIKGAAGGAARGNVVGNVGGLSYSRFVHSCRCNAHSLKLLT